MVLAQGQLHYYSSPLSMHELKGAVRCRDIVSIRDMNTAYQGRTGISLSFNTGAAEDQWVLDWDSQDMEYHSQLSAERTRDMWMRKIYRSCPQIMQRIKRRQSIHKEGLRGRNQTRNSVKRK